MSFKQAKALLPRPVALKSASPEFLAWFNLFDKKTSTPKYIVEEFSKSAQSVHGPVSNESQRLMQLGDWAAGVAMGKVKRQTRWNLIVPKLGIAYNAYSLLLDKPPADLGAQQLRALKNKQSAIAELTLIVMQHGHIKYTHVPTPADFVRIGPFDKY